MGSLGILGVLFMSGENTEKNKELLGKQLSWRQSATETMHSRAGVWMCRQKNPPRRDHSLIYREKEAADGPELGHR